MSLKNLKKIGLKAKKLRFTMRFTMSNAGKDTDCYSDPNVINHAVCLLARVTLELFFVFSLFSCQQSIVHKEFYRRKKMKKNYVEDFSGAFLLWFSVWLFHIVHNEHFKHHWKPRLELELGEIWARTWWTWILLKFNCFC